MIPLNQDGHSFSGHLYSDVPLPPAQRLLLHFGYFETSDLTEVLRQHPSWGHQLEELQEKHSLRLVPAVDYNVQEYVYPRGQPSFLVPVQAGKYVLLCTSVSDPANSILGERLPGLPQFSGSDAGSALDTVAPMNLRPASALPDSAKFTLEVALPPFEARGPMLGMMSVSDTGGQVDNTVLPTPLGTALSWPFRFAMEVLEDTARQMYSLDVRADPKLASIAVEEVLRAFSPLRESPVFHLNWPVLDSAANALRPQLLAVQQAIETKRKEPGVDQRAQLHPVADALSLFILCARDTASKAERWGLAKKDLGEISSTAVDTIGAVSRPTPYQKDKDYTADEIEQALGWARRQLVSLTTGGGIPHFSQIRSDLSDIACYVAHAMTHVSQYGFPAEKERSIADDAITVSRFFDLRVLPALAVFYRRHPFECLNPQVKADIFSALERIGAAWVKFTTRM